MRFGPERGGRRPGRLTVRPEFLAVAAGRRAHGPTCTVQFLERDGAPDGLRAGLTVTKRVGHATERNRIRRRLRAALLEMGGRLDLPADVVLVGRRDALGAPFQRLVADLARGLDRAARPGRGSRAESRFLPDPGSDRPQSV